MSKNKPTQIPTFLRRFVVGRERDYIVENLSALVSSGVGVIESLNSVRDEIRSNTLRQIVNEITIDIQNGSPIWRAIEKSGLFRPSVVSLVKIGEKTGKLSENLSIVAEEARKNRSFRSKLQSAMLYPVFVLLITGIVGIGISWFILPKLAGIFGGLSLELPILTRIVIDFGVILGVYGHIIIPAIITFIVVIILVLFILPKTKHLGQTFLFHVPGIGRLIKEVEIARFGYLLGTLVEAGLPITDAIKSMEDATQMRSYKKLYAQMYSDISHGYSMRYFFSHYKKSRRLIPSTVQQMVITGERSGNLSEMLTRASGMYEDKIENTTKNVAVLLEPILLVIVWIGVILVALAVILPIYGLLGGVR